MSNRTKLLLAALAAVAVLSFESGSAPALRSISVTGGTIRATARSLTFTEEEGAFRVVCEVVMTLTLNRAIAKVTGMAVADGTYVAPRCPSGGKIIPLTSHQPAPFSYISFTGTLPNIRSFRIRASRVELLIEAFFGIAKCLYSGEMQLTTVEGLTVTSLRADETVGIPLASESLSSVRCPTRGFVSGSFILERAVTSRLI